MDSPEHLELIAQSRPDMLTSAHWKALEEWRSGAKFRILSIADQVERPNMEKIAA